MKKNRLLGPLLAGVAALVFLCGAAAQDRPVDRGTRDEARAMVERAIDQMRKVGPEQAFKEFTDPANAAWHVKDLYVFAYTMQGRNVAHGANDRLVGRVLIDMTDPNGRPLIRDLRDTAAQGGGWVEYEWPHPQTRRIESKASYVRKMLNFDGFLGVGVYR